MEDNKIIVDGLVSVIIPSRTEQYLNRTIRDILEKARGPIEIFPVLDGYPDDYEYERIIDSRVKYITFPVPEGTEMRKRQGINTAVSLSHGEFVCWLDAHCVVGPGFDEILKKDCEDKMVIVPRRYRLNVERWDKELWPGRPPIDYEYWMWQKIMKKNRFSGYRWDLKSELRKDIPIDDIFTAQGSFFFMKRKWFDECKLMKIEGYTGWGQEGEEVCLTTIKNGGRAVVDKNTWYAHLHKGRTHGRMYKWGDVTPSYNFTYNYWIHENRDVIRKIIEKFGMPDVYKGGAFPNWKSNWEEIIDAKDGKIHKR